MKYHSGIMNNGVDKGLAGILLSQLPNSHRDT
jgi:hypothetical protein